MSWRHDSTLGLPFFIDFDVFNLLNRSNGIKKIRILNYSTCCILPLKMHKGLFYTNSFITFLSSTKKITSQSSMKTGLILVRNELFFWNLLSL